MSRRYEDTVTVTIAGDEQDVLVRANVDYGPTGRGWGATLDGDIEISVNGAWVDADALDLCAGDTGRIADALCDLACEDDRSECVEQDDEDAP